MSQKLTVSEFRRVEDLSDFNEDFTKSYNEKSNLECFLEVDLQNLKIYMNFKIKRFNHIKNL